MFTRFQKQNKSANSALILNFYYRQATIDENIFGAPNWELIFGELSNCKFFQYYDSNIGLFTFALHIVIAFPTFR